MSVRGWPPAILTKTTPLQRRRGDGERVISFIENFCHITKDSIGGQAGELIRLLPWQRELTRNLFARRADGRYLHRQGYIGMPRKQGKSALISGYGLYSLLMGSHGGEVYCVASTKEQAKIVFGNVKRMVQLDPDLASEVSIFAEALHCPRTDSVLRVVAADALALEGLNPTFVILDEVHTYPDRALWDVFALASGARIEPMMVGITTAGRRTDASGFDSLAYRLYKYGEQVALGAGKGGLDDESFFCAWWSPRKHDVDSDDETAWKQANPALGDLIDPQEMADSQRKTPEAEFKTKRLNMWVDQATAWMPAGLWDKCVKPPPDDDTRWVIGLDGSYNNDSTALVAASVEDKPYLRILGLWERDDDPSWRVDIVEVEDAIRAFAKSNTVVEVAVDPYRWARTMAVLAEEGLPIAEYPQSPVRMVPATQRLYEAVVNRNMGHSGDPHLARHIGNAAIKVDSRGSRIIKSAFTRKIDAAIASVMAFDRAAWWAEKPAPKRRTAYGFGAA